MRWDRGIITLARSRVVVTVLEYASICFCDYADLGLANSVLPRKASVAHVLELLYTSNKI